MEGLESLFNEGTDMTEFQERVVSVLGKALNQIESTNRLASKLNTSRLAVYSACCSLERQGVLVSFRSDNTQWAALMWALARKTEAL